MLKFIFFLVATLPNSWAQRLGAVVGRLLFSFHNAEKQTAKINLSLCFAELSDQQQQQLLKATLVENTKTLLEMPRIFKKGGQYAIGLISEVEGIDFYHQAIANGNGVILLAPHLGNWELIAHYLNQFSPITAMFAPPQKRFLNDIMQQGRESSGARLVPADSNGVRIQLRHLKKGGVVGILPDQKPKKGHAGIMAPFMGHDAYTMLLVNRLSKRTNACVLLTFAERLAIGKGFKLHVMPAVKKIGSQDDLSAATALNQSVEQCVRMAPSQYQWTYKRFSIQDGGKLSPYPKKQ